MSPPVSRPGAAAPCSEIPVPTFLSNTLPNSKDRMSIKTPVHLRLPCSPPLPSHPPSLAGTSTNQFHRSYASLPRRVWPIAPSPRREADAGRAEAAIEAGDAAMKQRDYETAFAQYKAAADLLPESPVAHHLRRVALNGLDDAACAWPSSASPRAATRTPRIFARPCSMRSTTRIAIAQSSSLAHLEDPDYYNKTITPASVAMSRR